MLERPDEALACLESCSAICFLTVFQRMQQIAKSKVLDFRMSHRSAGADDQASGEEWNLLTCFEMICQREYSPNGLDH